MTNILANVTLDFTSVDTKSTGGVALMPSWLAKQLLINLALKPGSSKEIIGQHIDELRECFNVEGGVEKAVELSIQFVQTRQLISNVKAENWSAYEVAQEVPDTQKVWEV